MIQTQKLIQKFISTILLGTSVIVLSACGSGNNAASKERVSDLQREYLRQILILDKEYVPNAGYSPNTIRGTFLVHHLNFGEPVVEDCIFVNDRAIGLPLRMAYNSMDLKENVTFFEVFSENAEKYRLPTEYAGDVIEEKEINEECLIVISEREKKLVVSQYKNHSITDKHAYECAAKANLYFFGIPFEVDEDQYILKDHQFYSEGYNPWGIAFDFEAIRSNVKASEVCGL